MEPKPTYSWSPGPGHGWTRFTLDDFLGPGPLVVFGVYVRVSVTGASVTLYDGLDTGSGRSIMVIEGEANITKTITFPGGLKIERALYVDLGSNVDEVLVLWDSLPQL